MSLWFFHFSFEQVSDLPAVFVREGKPKGSGFNYCNSCFTDSERVLRKPKGSGFNYCNSYFTDSERVLI